MRGRPSAEKRRKELSRQDRKKEKAARREQRKAEKATSPSTDSDEDPDIAGIVPGPQPLPWDDEEDESAARPSRTTTGKGTGLSQNTG